MNHYDYHKKMEYLKEILQKERKCTPEILSKSFGVSRRTVVRMITCLRHDGHIVKFDHLKGTYLFDQEN